MEIVLNDQYLLGNILLFLEVCDLRFTFQVCEFWMLETRYALRNTIVTPWMKTLFPHHSVREEKYQFGVDRDRGIVVSCILNSSKLKEIHFSSICYPNRGVFYQFETPEPKGSDVLKSVLKIQARYTFENKHRYFVALDLNKVFQLVEFTDLNNIVSYHINDEHAYSKFAYGFPWFYHFTNQLNLPPYQKTHNLQILPPPTITDQGYSIVGFFQEWNVNSHHNYDVYKDGCFQYSKPFHVSFLQNNQITYHHAFHLIFGQYLKVNLPGQIIFYNLLSENYMKPILRYEHWKFERVEVWSANEPFLFIENQTQNRINLINLEEGTCKTILPKFRSMDLEGINHITVIKNNHIFENYFTKYQQHILKFFDI